MSSASAGRRRRHPREMLEEAIEVMRLSGTAGSTSHRGRHFTVENARIYTLPEEPLDVLVAAGGVEAAELAGRIGDGLIGTAPDEATLDAFDGAGGTGKPRYAQVDRLLGRDRGGGSAHGARVVAKRGARRAARPGASASLALRGGGRDGHRGRRRKGHRLRARRRQPPGTRRQVREGGYTHVYVHQVGPDQDGFLDFYASEILPRYSSATVSP